MSEKKRDGFAWNDIEELKKQVVVITPVVEDQKEDGPLWKMRRQALRNAQKARQQGDLETYEKEKEKVREYSAAYLEARGEDYPNPTFRFLNGLALDHVEEGDYATALSLFKDAELYARTSLEKAKALANQAYAESYHQQDGWYDRAVRLNFEAYKTCPADEMPLINSLSLALKANRSPEEIGYTIKSLAKTLTWGKGSMAESEFRQEPALQKAKEYPEYDEYIKPLRVDAEEGGSEK